MRQLFASSGGVQNRDGHSTKWGPRTNPGKESGDEVAQKLKMHDALCMQTLIISLFLNALSNALIVAYMGSPYSYPPRCLSKTHCINFHESHRCHRGLYNRHDKFVYSLCLSIRFLEGLDAWVIINSLNWMHLIKRRNFGLKGEV